MSLIRLVTSPSKYNAMLSTEDVMHKCSLDCELQLQFFAGEIYIPSIRSIQLEFVDEQFGLVPSTY
ncbi:hypothetical protein THZG08_70117 [Vibrio owensii]|nr:hypothetical protein THZG08_70117 [Vibrio owensii]CAH1590770.1 hypothetical protein THOA03_70119 [Vibrio owensii]